MKYNRALVQFKRKKFLSYCWFSKKRPNLQLYYSYQSLKKDEMDIGKKSKIIWLHWYVTSHYSEVEILIYIFIWCENLKIKNKIIYPFRSSTNISYVFRVPLFAMQTPFTHVFLSSVLKLNEIEMRFLRKFFILHVGNEYSLVPEVYAVLWILVDSAKCDARTSRQSIGLFVVTKQIP